MLADIVVAQAGGHPHVAPRVPGFSLVPDKISPLMNEADGFWNMGESTEGADIGGVLGADTFDPVASRPVFVPILPPPHDNGWKGHPRSPATMVHYVGRYHRPPAEVQGDETRASFEVVAPASIAPGGKVVVLISTPPTFTPAQLPKQAPHNYPGDPNYHDLLVVGGNGTHVDFVDPNWRSWDPVPPFDRVGVQFTPRTSERPTAFKPRAI